MICPRCINAILTQAELKPLGQSEGHREASFSSMEWCPSCYNLAAIEELVPAAVSILSLELCRLDVEQALLGSDSWMPAPQGHEVKSWRCGEDSWSLGL